MTPTVAPGTEFAIHCDACGLCRGDLGPESDLVCCGGAVIADDEPLQQVRLEELSRGDDYSYEVGVPQTSQRPSICSTRQQAARPQIQQRKP